MEHISLFQFYNVTVRRKYLDGPVKGYIAVHWYFNVPLEFADWLQRRAGMILQPLPGRKGSLHIVLDVLIIPLAPNTKAIDIRNN